MTNETLISAASNSPARTFLHDTALGEHSDETEVVDREPGIAPDCGVRQPGIRPVGVPAELDVVVVIGEEELVNR